MSTIEQFVSSEAEMRALGGTLQFEAGDTVFLTGDLGSGKTTLVRGYLEAHGYKQPVRSPTFNLLQVFETDQPVLHVDLYRVQDFHGLGIEDYLSSHICFIEWAERAEGLLPKEAVWRVEIAFSGEARSVRITPPAKAEPSKQ